jgi:hypothetical protein
MGWMKCIFILGKAKIISIIAVVSAISSSTKSADRLRRYK